MLKKILLFLLLVLVTGPLVSSSCSLPVEIFKNNAIIEEPSSNDSNVPANESNDTNTESDVDKSDKTYSRMEDTDKKEPDNMQIDTGTFLGRIDPHSIEIRLSGVQPEDIFHVFWLSDELIESFDDLAIEEGSIIKIEYIEVDENKKVIYEITMMGE
jgi:hypothetical protein